MPNSEIEYEILEQYDWVTNDFIDKVSIKLYPLIGQFLIKFSILEHELNVIIAEHISDRAHETGYIVLEKITMSNKIDLFYKLYLRLEKYKKDSLNEDTIEKLKILKKRIEDLNTFRNYIAHANWQTITNKWKVRTKIVYDNSEAFVKFRLIKLTPTILKKQIKNVEIVTNKIIKYGESAFDF